MSKSEFDPDILFPPEKFIKIEDVPVFDEHESAGTNGKPRKITKEMLVKLARNCNKKFEEVGAATPLSLGHTLDNKAEEEQPPIVGWAVNFRVGPLLKTGRDALYCDWYIRKKHENVIEEYPNRSIELWPSRLDISPIALLKSTAPERDLPIIKYYQTPDEEPYKYVFTPPTKESLMNPSDNKVMNDAALGETSSIKQLSAEVGELKEQFQAFMQMFMQLMEEGGEDEENPLKPGDEDENEDETEDEDEKAGPAKKKDSKKAEDKEDVAKGGLSDQRSDSPVKMDAGMYAGGGNVYVPSTETKAKMSRNDDDKVKFERLVTEAVGKATDSIRKENDTLRRENLEIKKHFNRMQAEKAVATLEREHNIDFGDENEKETETQFFADLLTEDKSGKSFSIHFDKVAKKYKRKEAEKPDSVGVHDMMRYARTDDPAPTFSSADDICDFVAAYTKDNSLTPEKYAANKNGVKK